MNNESASKHESYAIMFIALCISITFIIDDLIHLITTCGFIYLIFKIIEFEKDTGKMTSVIMELIDLRRTVITKDIEPALKPQEVGDKLTNLSERFDTLSQEIESNLNSKIKELTIQYDRGSKASVLNNIMRIETNIDYAKSSNYERELSEKTMEKRRSEIWKKEMSLQMESKYLQQDQNILALKDGIMNLGYNLKELIRSQYETMQSNFNQLKDNVKDLSCNLINMKSYFEQKFALTEAHFTKEISRVDNVIGNLKVYVDKEFANTKLKFGSEINNIYKQQIGIVDKLGQYRNMVKDYQLEVKNCKQQMQITSQRTGLALQRVHQTANFMNERMNNFSTSMKNEVAKVALHDQAFAVTVGNVMNGLERKSMEIERSLKDMGYLDMGQQLLRQSYSQQNDRELHRIEIKKMEMKELETKIKHMISENESVTHLESQLQSAKDDMRYMQNRQQLMALESQAVRNASR